MISKDTKSKFSYHWNLRPLTSQEEEWVATWLVLGFVAVKSHHEHGNFYEVKHLTGPGLQCRDLVHCHHGRKHGGTQAGMVLNEEFYSWIGRQRKERKPHWAWLEHQRPQSSPPVTPFLQQSHTYSMSPYSAIPHGPTRAIFIPTTTLVLPPLKLWWIICQLDTI